MIILAVLLMQLTGPIPYLVVRCVLMLDSFSPLLIFSTFSHLFLKFDTNLLHQWNVPIICILERIFSFRIPFSRTAFSFQDYRGIFSFQNHHYQGMMRLRFEHRHLLRFRLIKNVSMPSELKNSHFGVVERSQSFFGSWVNGHCCCQ